MTEKAKTGYPSIDKPWAKYYSEEVINATLPNGSMYELLHDCNAKHPHDIALKYYGTNVKFSELFAGIDNAAASFAAQGVKRGDTVLFFTVSMPEVVCSIYGLNKIGAVCNFINALSSAEEAHNYLLECKCEVMVCLDLFAEKAISAIKGTNVKKVVVLSVADSMPFVKKVIFKNKLRSKVVNFKADEHFITWDEFSKIKSDGITTSSCGEDVAIVGHTGGTTGFPKSVLLSNYAMNAVAFQYVKMKIFRRKEVGLNIIVPQSVYGISINVHAPLCSGISLAIIPKFDGADWPKYMKWYKPNHIAVAPPHLIPLLSFKNIDLSSLVTVAFGGDSMTPTMEENINEFLKNHGCKSNLIKGYGLSETAAAAVMTYNDYNKIQSVGIPLPKNNVMIWDEENNTECGYGVIGEVCIAGPGLMKGYADNPEATAKMIRVHSDGTRWLHSGDLGYIDEDGFLYIDGRIKRIILSYKDGVCGKIYPDRVEKLLSTVKSVKLICIVGAPDRSRGFVANAYVVLKDEYANEKSRAEQELTALCKKELPDYAQPTKYIFRESLPLTPVGKVDYRALEKEAEEA